MPENGTGNGLTNGVLAAFFINGLAFSLPLIPVCPDSVILLGYLVFKTIPMLILSW